MVTVLVLWGRPEREATLWRETGSTDDTPCSGVPGHALVSVLPVVSSSAFGSVGYFSISNVSPFLLKLV